jgi:hypothetical protein
MITTRRIIPIVLGAALSGCSGRLATPATTKPPPGSVAGTYAVESALGSFRGCPVGGTISLNADMTFTAAQISGVFAGARGDGRINGSGRWQIDDTDGRIFVTLQWTSPADLASGSAKLALHGNRPPFRLHLGTANPDDYDGMWVAPSATP